MMKSSLLPYIFNIFSCAAALLLTACGAKVPNEATPTHSLPDIYPDYADATIPVNIAPLNFKITTEGEAFATRVRTRDNDGFAVDGRIADFPIDKWSALLAQSLGDSIFIDVFVNKDGNWFQYSPVKLAVAEDIDPYISYRLIEPSYVNFEVMRIRQRSLCDFQENDIYNNCPYASEGEGQCINCHSYQNYNREGNWQMHVRITNGGTILCTKDGVKKINLKLPQTISAGVYPAWHPTLPLIAYSNNSTSQIFHYSDPNKIEVQDSASDLILYDADKGQIQFIANAPDQWETFPAWSPDGKYLYYVSTTVPAEA